MGGSEYEVEKTIPTAFHRSRVVAAAFYFLRVIFRDCHSVWGTAFAVPVPCSDHDRRDLIWTPARDLDFDRLRTDGDGRLGVRRSLDEVGIEVLGAALG